MVVETISEDFVRQAHICVGYAAQIRTDLPRVVRTHADDRLCFDDLVEAGPPCLALCGRGSLPRLSGAPYGRPREGSPASMRGLVGRRAGSGGRDGTGY